MDFTSSVAAVVFAAFSVDNGIVRAFWLNLLAGNYYLQCFYFF